MTILNTGTTDAARIAHQTNIEWLTSARQSNAKMEAGAAFDKAHFFACVHARLARLRGHTAELEHLPTHCIGNRAPINTQTISIDDIIGSEDRSDEFDTDFKPLRYSARDRWINIFVAELSGNQLPPIEVIRNGSAYYVRDGHHRISVAKQFGQHYIDAVVVSGN